MTVAVFSSFLHKRVNQTPFDKNKVLRALKSSLGLLQGFKSKGSKIKRQGKVRMGQTKLKKKAAIW